MEKKKILVLGSTGSIGQQTLDVVRQNLDLFELEGISCNDNIELIEQQAQEFGIKKVAIANKKRLDKT